MLVLSYKCMRASNSDATRVAKTIQNLKVFRYVTYFAIAIIIFLFLILGIPWLSDSYYRNSGGGGVMAFFYITPILLLDVIMTLYFIIVSIAAVASRKKIGIGSETIKRQYQYCFVVLGIMIILSLCSIIMVTNSFWFLGFWRVVTSPTN